MGCVLCFMLIPPLLLRTIVSRIVGQIHKRVLRGGAFFTLGLIVVIGVIVHLIEPNDYKSRIAALVKSKFDRDISFEGDIDLSLFPEIILKTGRVVVNNLPDFKGQPFLMLDKGEIKVKLWPLFSRKIEVSEINLVNLTVNLQSNNEGLNNWTDLGVQRPPPSANKVKMKNNDFLAGSSFAVDRIKVQNGRVNVDNGQAGTLLELKKIEINFDQVVIGNLFGINLSLVLSGTSIKPETRLKLTALMRFDETPNDVVFSNCRVEYMGFNPFPSNADLNADLSAQEIAIHRNSQTVNISNLQFQSQGFKLSANLRGEKIMDQSVIRSEISIAPFNPIAVAKQWGLVLPTMKDQAALTNLSGDFNLNAGTDFAQISALNIKLDRSRIGGFVMVKQFAEPSILFDLTVDELDCDRYLAAEDKSKNSWNDATNNVGAATTGFIERFKKLDANGQLRVGMLRTYNTTSKDIRLMLNSKKGFSSRANH